MNQLAVTDFVAISDVHINLKNITVSLQVLRQALDLARKHGCALMIAGDLNDTKAVLRSEYVKDLMDLFDEFYDVTVYVMVGNHDLNNKSSEKHSLEFLRKHSNIIILDKPERITLGNENWGIIPYCNTDEKFLQCVQDFKGMVDKLITHQGYHGAFMGDYVIDKSSVHPDCVKDFKLVLSGHYHKHQWLNNIMYFGSPFTVDFGESNQDKWIWKVGRTIANEVAVQPIPSTARRHYQFEFDGEIPESLPQLTQDSLVKVVLKGSKEFALSVSADEMRKKLGCDNTILVPDITKQSNHRISAEALSDPIKVIENYLMVANTDFDKQKLREYLFSKVEDIINNNVLRSTLGFKVCKIEWENFLSYEKGEFDYEEKRGLTSVEGYDQDNGVNTGTGKSTLLDVAPYGIFGKTSKKLKADEVLNRKHGRNLYVKTILEKSNGRYDIIRYRKHKEFGDDLYMLVPGSTEPMRGKDNKETQKLIEQELGCDFDMFLRATYFTQFSAIDRFLSASDTEKKKIASEISDTKIFDEMLEVIKKSLKVDREKLQEIDFDRTRADNSVEITENRYKAKKLESENWEQNKLNSLKELEIQYQQFENDKKANIMSLEQLRDRFEEAKQDAIEVFHGYMNQFEEQRNLALIELEKSRVSFDENEEKAIAQLQDQKTKKLQELSAIAEDVKRFKSIPKRDFDADIASIQHTIDSYGDLDSGLTIIGNQIAIKESKVSDIKNKLSELESRKQSPNCPFCFQNMSFAHIDKHKQQLENELNKLATELNQDSSVRDSIIQKKSLVDSLKEDINKVNRDKQSFENERQRIISQQSLAEQINQQIQHLNSSMLNRPVNPYILQIDQKKMEQNPYPHKIELEEAKQNPYVSQIETKKNETNPYKLDMEHIQKSQNPHISDVENLKVDLDKFIKEFNEIIDKREAVDLEIKIGSWWKDALHIYIKSYLMDSFLEQLNEISNSNLDKLFNGLLKIDISAVTESKKDIKEKVSITIYNNGDECSYESLSGGERCRICLAVNLALRSIITRANSGAFNYLALDEVLNGLDEVGKNQTMKLLKELEDEIDTIFMIDHTEEFKQLFNSTVEIIKKSGVSTIL